MSDSQNHTVIKRRRASLEVSHATQKAAGAQICSVQNTLVRAHWLEIVPLQEFRETAFTGSPLRLVKWKGYDTAVQALVNLAAMLPARTTPLSGRDAVTLLDGCLTENGHFLMRYRTLHGREGYGIATIPYNIVTLSGACTTLPVQPVIQNLADHAVDGHVLIDMRSGPTLRYRLRSASRRNSPA